MQCHKARDWSFQGQPFNSVFHHSYGHDLCIILFFLHSLTVMSAVQFCVPGPAARYCFLPSTNDGYLFYILPTFTWQDMSLLSQVIFLSFKITGATFRKTFLLTILTRQITKTFTLSFLNLGNSYEGFKCPYASAFLLMEYTPLCVSDICSFFFFFSFLNTHFAINSSSALFFSPHRMFMSFVSASSQNSGFLIKTLPSNNYKFILSTF